MLYEFKIGLVICLISFHAIPQLGGGKSEIDDKSDVRLKKDCYLMRPDEIPTSQGAGNNMHRNRRDSTVV
ncbi:MAG: hypothetical protein A2038_06850 [Deltaproteobacteria bacterium GWA2_57_13]|nr:MAG: hypothetical protein A2038_06850 [Deltaproteobacteria bacterium GWA2_57_13]